MLLVAKWRFLSASIWGFTHVFAYAWVSAIDKSSGDAGLIKIDEECSMSWVG